MAQTEHRATNHVLDIFSLLASSTEGFTLNEIAKNLNAPRTSLYPIIHTMAARNFVSFNKETSRYCTGYNAYATGAPFLEQRGAYGVILEEMNKISTACEELCQLGVLDKQDVLYIGKVDSPAAIRTVSHIGKKLPAYCTALGKALTYQFSREKLDLFFTLPLDPLTPYTTVDLDKLYEQLCLIKENGYAYESEETQVGVNCFAIPVCKNGEPIAAISISSPVFRMTPQLREHFIKTLLESKERLELMLGEISTDNLKRTL